MHVDLPGEGEEYSKGETPCAIESVKTAADVYMPCDCSVHKINEQLEEEP